jgi:Flp pilus assembly pilin Flp
MRPERGQTIVEYGLVLALIAALVLAAVSLLGPMVVTWFTYIGNIINGT